MSPSWVNNDRGDLLWLQTKVVHDDKYRESLFTRAKRSSDDTESAESKIKWERIALLRFWVCRIRWHFMKRYLAEIKFPSKQFPLLTFSFFIIWLVSFNFFLSLTCTFPLLILTLCPSLSLSPVSLFLLSFSIIIPVLVNSGGDGGSEEGFSIIHCVHT